MVHQRVHEHIPVLTDGGESNALFLTASRRFSCRGSLWDGLETATSNPGEIRGAALEPRPLAGSATRERRKKI